MDNIPDLPAFQAVLRAANNQYSFAELKFRDSTEEKIKYIVQKGFVFLKEKNYITEYGAVQQNCHEYKKLALYLVLNADLPVLTEMSELPGGVGALVRTLPPLPGPLLVELFRGLHMRPFLYEMVTFCRPVLALQLAGACIADWPGDRDQEYRLRLAEALYRLTCRLHFLRTPLAGAPGAALAGVYACFSSLYCSRHVRTLVLKLSLLETWYDLFTSVQRFEDKDFDDIYRATHGPDGLAPEALKFKICDSPDPAISGSLRACNALLLDHCAELVTNVSVDEFSVCSGSTVKDVCVRYFRMKAMLLSIPDATDHRLVDMLDRIAKWSLDLEKVADGMDPDVIVAQNCAREATGTAWLDMLLRTPALYRHPGALRLLRSKAATFDDNQNLQLFNTVKFMECDPAKADLCKTVAIEAFLRCSDSTKDRIVTERFRFHFHDALMTVDFEAALSETFDRLAAGEAGPGDALAVFVQNPRRTLERLVRAAGDGAVDMEVLLGIVERLGELRHRSYEGQPVPVLVQVLNAALDAAIADDARHHQLTRFVEELCQRELLYKEWLWNWRYIRIRDVPASKEHEKSSEKLHLENVTAESQGQKKPSPFGEQDEAKASSESFGQSAKGLSSHTTLPVIEPLASTSNTQGEPTFNTQTPGVLMNKNKTEEQDPIDAFFKGLAPTLKSFSPRLQHLAKEQVFKAIHDLELRQLTENSSLPSTPAILSSPSPKSS